jgi:hypothetical protein
MRLGSRVKSNKDCLRAQYLPEDAARSYVRLNVGALFGPETSAKSVPVVSDHWGVRRRVTGGATFGHTRRGAVRTSAR